MATVKDEERESATNEDIVEKDKETMEGEPKPAEVVDSETTEDATVKETEKEGGATGDATTAEAKESELGKESESGKESELGKESESSKESELGKESESGKESELGKESESAKESESGKESEDMETESEEDRASGQSNDHIYSDGWSKLSKEELIDRIKGMVYGQAIGDALGLATEFMSKVEAKKYYKNKLSYDVIVRDFHRSRWDQADWTDDTDQMLLIMLMIIESNGGVNQLDFAARLHNWTQHGFKEFGDCGGMGIGATVSRTVRHPIFCKEPAKAAKSVWEASGRYLAANGAIMRTSILGALNFNDISRVVSNTVAIAEVTHADPRCKASCVAVTVAIALMLQGEYNLEKKQSIDAIIKKATEEASKLFEHEPQQKEMVKHIHSSLAGLELDDRNTIGYTFKAMGCGFYGLKQGSNFKKIITDVIMEAGDADSNAAVCGAVLGCKIGFKKLPEDLLKLKHKDWLETKVNAFLKVTGLLD